MVQITSPLGKRLDSLLNGVSTSDVIPPIDIITMTSDSRAAVSGALFVALKGTQTHGIDFAANAVKAGASVVLYNTTDSYCQQRMTLLKKQLSVPCLGVENLDQIHGDIVSRFYGDPSFDLCLIGVTGTDGKTSVTHLISQALSQLGRRVGSIGTLGYGIDNQFDKTNHTTPDAFALQSYLHDFKQQQCTYVVMEVSSHALDQSRVQGCQFDVAVLTNLGRDHLDYHGDIACYAAAKSRLFTDFELSGRVINSDDEFGRSLSVSFQSEGLIRYAASCEPNGHDAEVRLISRQFTDQGQDIIVATPLGKVVAKTALIGDFNIDNTLACIASLITLGFELDEINAAVSNLRPIPGRMEKIYADQDMAAAVIDFAHTEQALRACLTASRAHTDGKLWCVFGCGGDRDPGKREGMAQAAEQLADRVIITDDNPRTESAEAIVADILKGMADPAKADVIYDRFAAIEFALSQANSDDLVVIAGKGHESDQIIGLERHPFSDRKAVLNVMQAKKKKGQAKP